MVGVAGRTLAAAGLVGLCLVGCAGPSGERRAAESKAALDRAPICCRSLAEARRQKLPLEATAIQVDGTTSQAFDFGGNKAFFQLFELPPFTKTYSVVLTSSGLGAAADMALFIPRVAVYDADFQVTRHFDEKSLRNRGNDLERTVFFNPGNSAERYIAVYGADLAASIERAYSMVTVTPVAAGPIVFNIVSGADGKSILRASAGGTLQIEVRGLAPVK